MVTSLCIAFEIGIQKVGKEKYFQNHEQYEKFEPDDDPGLFTPFGHVGKTIFVKQYDLFKKSHGQQSNFSIYKVKSFSFNFKVKTKKRNKN